MSNRRRQNLRYRPDPVMQMEIVNLQNLVQNLDEDLQLMRKQYSNMSQFFSKREQELLNQIEEMRKVHQAEKAQLLAQLKGKNDDIQCLNTQHQHVIYSYEEIISRNLEKLQETERQLADMIIRETVKDIITAVFEQGRKVYENIEDSFSLISYFWRDH
ncbi:uncharacterized protein LOC114576508 [Exaiptasia diaphana]|uniref:Uncharacterized protein n=1 Tax=Exaiptasia diaphana TaxID=2652724 RepID=A0A913YVH6_EXADI|nr:uncharacterized protein LOC114576508 [Exaiptasia diaphana]